MLLLSETDLMTRTAVETDRVCIYLYGNLTRVPVFGLNHSVNHRWFPTAIIIITHSAVAPLCSESWTAARPRRLGSAKTPYNNATHRTGFLSATHPRYTSRLRVSWRVYYCTRIWWHRRQWRRAPELPRPVYNANVLVNHVSLSLRGRTMSAGGRCRVKNTRRFLPQTRVRVSRWCILIYIYIRFCTP